MVASMQLTFPFPVKLCLNITREIHVPLTNQVQGPYRKLRTELFPLRFMAQALARGPEIEGEKARSVTYGTDLELG